MKIGDYVITKHYGISKITDIYNENKIELDKVNAFGIKGVCYIAKNIIKSSPNIIDLIEVGDYVNGYKVLFAGATAWDNDGNVIDKRVKINHDGYDRWLSEDFIKSIVTKEQFSSMEFKIGE